MTGVRLPLARMSRSTLMPSRPGNPKSKSTRPKESSARKPIASQPLLAHCASMCASESAPHTASPIIGSSSTSKTFCVIASCCNCSMFNRYAKPAKKSARRPRSKASFCLTDQCSCAACPDAACLAVLLNKESKNAQSQPCLKSLGQALLFIFSCRTV